MLLSQENPEASGTEVILWMTQLGYIPYTTTFMNLRLTSHKKKTKHKKTTVPTQRLTQSNTSSIVNVTF